MIVTCRRICFVVLVLSVAVLGQGDVPLTSTSSSAPHTVKSGRSGAARPAARKTRDERRLIEYVESSLLNVFGLKNRPKPTGDTVIPQYMLDLYDLHMRRPGATSPYMQTKGRGLTTANTIRSFYHKDISHLPECTEHTCVRMWFNVSSIPFSEDLSAAELRVFKEVFEQFVDSDATHNSADRLRVPNHGRKATHKLEVHEIMQPTGQNSECISRLIDTKVMDFRNSSWESFDVHSAVLKWKNKPRFNHGLEIRLVSSDPSLSAEAHVRLRRSALSHENQWQEKRPLLVAYTDDGRNPPKSRSKRGSRSRRRKNKRKKRRRKKGHKNQCRRHALYVDFNDVGWNDWIVAPTGYNAFYCNGKCPFPLANHLNSTNHAIVQTLVNSVNPTAVPEVCCVPTELSAISMLYLDERDKIVLKTYKDMVVDACGCR